MVAAPLHNGMLMVNLMHFGRLLRALGMPVGTDRILQAIEAVDVVGLDSKSDLFWTLHAVLVDRAAHRRLFAQAFTLFWRNPDMIKRLMLPLLPTVPLTHEQETLTRRLKEALNLPSSLPRRQEVIPPRSRLEFDATLTWSSRESLYHKDFAQMTQAEIRVAQEAIRHLSLSLGVRPSRRFCIASHGHGSRVDLSRTLKRMMRTAGEVISVVIKRPRMIKRPVVVLCDISGSMESYVRMLLHFMHGLFQYRKNVHGFVFATRLTCITRELRYTDVDIALEKVSRTVCDWSGGTRIGKCLHCFNCVWGRRVLGQGAIVILISDGLDQDAGSGLGLEVERLQKSCRWLIWLNPLLRYAEFTPRALGIRAILPHVDDFRSIHNLSSLLSLSTVLSQEPHRRQRRYKAV